MHPLLRGAIGGTLATVPMTLVMTYLFRRLPKQQQYPLPPLQITDEIAQRTGAKPIVRGARLTAAALFAHFAYGAATGALYGPVAKRLASSVHPGVGAAYGIGVWLASYLGWIPAARILPPATEHPKQRNVLMLAAHLVWGTALSMVTKQLERHERKRSTTRERT